MIPCARIRRTLLTNANLTDNMQSEPKRVQALAHERIVKAAAGTGHTLCITSQGVLYAFGAHYERLATSSHPTL
jgi:hypothetical protein